MPAASKQGCLRLPVSVPLTATFESAILRLGDMPFFCFGDGQICRYARTTIFKQEYQFINPKELKYEDRDNANAEPGNPDDWFQAMPTDKEIDKPTAIDVTKQNDGHVETIMRMEGDVPADKQTEEEVGTIADAGTVPTERPAKRKRNQAADYAELFLNRNELRNRQGLYISRENYEVLQVLVRSIRNERLSVSGLVDNIVRHHIEVYGDEINRIYENNTRKPVP
jgi:hypothetical protein